MVQARGHQALRAGLVERSERQPKGVTGVEQHPVVLGQVQLIGATRPYPAQRCRVRVERGAPDHGARHRLEPLPVVEQHERRATGLLDRATPDRGRVGQQR